MSPQVTLQIGIFIAITAVVAFFTWRHCRQAPKGANDSKEYFLANNGLNWVLVAGSITLTNINTDTIFGWNGNQMLLITWWELAGVIGLLALAWIFLPVYYHYKCTTVTELLEQRYRNPHIRGTVAAIFLLGDVLIFLPVMLYTSSLLLKTMFGLPFSLPAIACFTATLGAAYAIFGGLRAVAFCDTYNGILVFGMAILITVLSLNAVDWDLSGLPPERTTMIGDANSVLPWPALLTGMLFTQLYYFSTNQTITQRALAAPSVREARKGVHAAALIRILLVPPIVALPGICAYKLYGKLGDQTYGHIVQSLLPQWMLGIFAAAMVGAVISSYTATLNSAATLAVCDIHELYFKVTKKLRTLGIVLQLIFVAISIALVGAYMHAGSIIQLIQQLIGLFSMPILSAFITGLLFRNVDARAVIATILFGAVFYASLSFGWPALASGNPSIPKPPHFLHLMFVTELTCIGFALVTNRLCFGRRATFVLADAASRQKLLALYRKAESMPVK